MPHCSQAPSQCRFQTLLCLVVRTFWPSPEERHGLAWMHIPPPSSSDWSGLSETWWVWSCEFPHLLMKVCPLIYLLWAFPQGPILTAQLMTELHSVQFTGLATEGCFLLLPSSSLLPLRSTGELFSLIVPVHTSGQVFTPGRGAGVLSLYLNLGSSQGSTGGSAAAPAPRTTTENLVIRSVWSSRV